MTKLPEDFLESGKQVQIRNNSLKIIWSVFCSMILCLTLLSIWIHWVEPFPDRDSINQFFYPIRNYLFASFHLENNFSFLKELSSSEYPRGLMVLAWLLSALGLESLILSNTHILIVFLTIPFFVVALLCSENRTPWVAFLIPVILYFFPPLHLHFKNFNLHAFCLFYFLAGLMLFRRLNKEKATSITLIVPGLFFWVSIIMKHLGLILFLGFALSELIYRIVETKSPRQFIIFCLCTCVAALPFYPVQGIQEYFFHSLRHNMDLNPIQFLAGLTVALGLVNLSIIFLKNLNSKPFIAGSRFWIFNVVLQSVLILLILSLGSNFHRINWLLSSGVILTSTILMFLVRYGIQYEQNREILLILVLHLIACLLYFSRVGQVIVLFMVPLSWTLILWLRTYPRPINILLITLVFISISNFFPSLKSLENLFGKYAFYIYSRGFNTLDMNPFGWQKSDAVESREKLKLLMEMLDFKNKEILVSYSNLHLHSALHLLFPDQLEHKIPNMLIPQSLKDEKLESLYQKLSENMEMQFDLMSRKGEIPLVFWRTKSWKDYLINPDQDFHSKVPPRYSRMQFCFWFHQAYWRFLVRTKTLDRDYRMEVVRSKYNETYVYIHKSVKHRESIDSYTQSKRFKNLTQHFSHLNRPKIRKAHELFLLSNRYLDSNQFLYAVILLRQAQKLNPAHPELLKDLRIALKQLKSVEKKILNIYPTDLLAQAITSTGSIPFSQIENNKLSPEPYQMFELALDREFKASNEALKLYQSAWKWGIEIPLMKLWIDRLNLLLSGPYANTERSLYVATKKNPRSSIKSILEQLKLSKDSLSLKTLDFLEKENLYMSNWIVEIENSSKINSKQINRLREESRLMSDLPIRLSDSLFNRARIIVSKNPKRAKELVSLAHQVQQISNLNKDKKDFNAALEMDLQIANDNKIEPDVLAHKIANNIYHDNKFWGYNSRDKKRINAARDSQPHLENKLFEIASKIFNREPEDAQSILSLVLELNPKHKEARQDLNELNRIIEESKQNFGDKAHRLFLESTKYFDSNPTKAINFLEKVLIHNPNHIEAIEDLRFLKEKRMKN